MSAARKKIRLSRTTRHLIFGSVVLLIIIGCSVGVWHYTRQPELTITQVTVSGGETISELSVADVVRDELSGTYLGLVPRTFSYLYPEAKIASAVKTIPAVQDVSVERIDKQTVAVNFTEYQPFALWCAFAGEYCVFVDAAGYAYAQAPQLDGSTFVRFFREATPVQVGRTVLVEAELQSVLTLVRLLEQDFQFQTWGVVIDSYGDKTFQLVHGGEIKIGRDSAQTAVIENLATILQSQEFAHLKPGNFQYIDLRFGDRVYVNENIAAPEVASSTATSTEEQTVDSDASVVDEGS